MTAQVEEVTSSAQSLADLALTLEKIVNQFKMDESLDASEN
jgi:methyl-accepting chemotaxis protein